jgi:tryptophan-rich sensory protein
MMISRIIIFLLLNFGALAIGGIFTGKGVPSEWYMELNKAPWTPPGWMFGFAWTTIMICFSFYMAYLWPGVENKNLIIGLFTIQWILNVAWSPVFFYFHKITGGLVIILLLTVLVGYLLFYFWPVLKVKSILLLPYFIWLLIASSLNAYIFFKN